MTYNGGWSFDASASTSQDKADNDSTQQVLTHIRATDGASFTSTADTSLMGARVEADRVSGQVGGDLTIESVQDTARAKAEQSSSGVSLGYGASGSGSYQGTNAGLSISVGQANGSYAMVSEQSGIHAGQGGFEVDVAGTTRLQGGALDSLASADKNSLSTGRLETQDIANHSEFNSSTFGVSLTYSSNDKNASNVGEGFNGTLDVPQMDSRDDRSTTQSVVAPGSIKLTQGDQKENDQQTASLNRDVQAERNKKALDRLPDLMLTLPS